MTILTVNLLFSTLVFSIAARSSDSCSCARVGALRAAGERRQEAQLGIQYHHTCRHVW